MRRLLLALCGALLAGTLAGCGNATDNLDFKVPPGYQSKLSLFGTQMWTRGDQQSPEVLFLMKLPVRMRSADFEKKMQQGLISSSLPSNLKHGKMVDRRQLTICGDHRAYYMKAIGNNNRSGSSQKEENIEMLFTSWNDTTYLSMYVYPRSSAGDAASEAALKSVCLKKP